MSAFVVSREHISYLVRAALSRSIVQYGPFSYFYAGCRHPVTPADAAKAGQMLWDENLASVRYRYGDSGDLPGPADEDFRYEHSARGSAPVPVEVIKACDCYEYQSCEHPDWENSRACAFIQALRRSACSALPGYDDAPWERQASSGGPEMAESSAAYYQCPTCGCQDVEGTAWMHLNSGKEADGDPPRDEYWCPQCEDTFRRVCLVERSSAQPRCRFHDEPAGEACPGNPPELPGPPTDSGPTGSSSSEKLEHTPGASLHNGKEISTEGYTMLESRGQAARMPRADTNPLTKAQFSRKEAPEESSGAETPAPKRIGSAVHEKLKGALDDLLGALEAGRSETLQTFLAAMGKFHKYSWGNVLLICSQCPDATHVAGYRTWKSLGRYVRKGEKGITIIAPVPLRTKDQETGEEETKLRFRAAHVFDISQTDGEELPDLGRPEGDPAEFLPRLKELTHSKGIKLDYSEDLGSALGRSSGGAISLAPGLSPAEEFSVLSHELAHELLHQAGGERPSKTVRETEAEAVAFVVSSSIGLKNGSSSADYIQLYSGDAATLTTSLERVQRTSTEIISALHPAEAAA